MSTLPLQLSATGGVPFHRPNPTWTSAPEHARLPSSEPMVAMVGWRAL
jgi:hypothetical protein